MGQVDSFPLFSGPTAREVERAGFRFGAKGTHTSRTMMFDELSQVLKATNQDARRADYASEIIDCNCLSKPTASTRRLSNQRLGELYGLDPAVPLFRVLRRLWDISADGRPLLALLAAIARDPLLAATCSAIVIMPANAELRRDALKEVLQAVVGDRLNESTLEKVCRNAASTWAQSGHLEGRTFKKRRIVLPSATAVTFAIYLAHAAGFRGAEIFSSGWLRVIDCDPPQARALALDAKRHGLLDLRMAGDVVELNLSRLDPHSAKA
ncbi:hypothetical protein [Xanthobacter autotrophicus]|uniref:hypothetical protein n=1 Tax=Xanthobacter autotrophicus TaxID=280 RepID=UPI00372C97B8